MTIIEQEHNLKVLLSFRDPLFLMLFNIIIVKHFL